MTVAGMTVTWLSRHCDDFARGRPLFEETWDPGVAVWYRVDCKVHVSPKALLLSRTQMQPFKPLLQSALHL